VLLDKVANRSLSYSFTQHIPAPEVRVEVYCVGSMVDLICLFLWCFQVLGLPETNHIWWRLYTASHRHRDI